MAARPWRQKDQVCRALWEDRNQVKYPFEGRMESWCKRSRWDPSRHGGKALGGWSMGDGTSGVAWPPCRDGLAALG